MKLIDIILDQMKKVSKPQRNFLKKAFRAFLSVSGKLNFRNMCRYVGLNEKTFTRQFAKAFDFTSLNKIIIKKIVGDTPTNQIMVFDPFFLPKSGDTTYGSGKFWSGCSGRVEKGVEASLLVIVDLKTQEGYALHASQTPSPTKLKDIKDLPSEATRMDWYLYWITSQSTFFPDNIKCLVVDAQFFKEKFVTGIRAIDLHVIGKMRRDAKLLALYNGQQKKRGRRKKYDGIVSFETLEDITVGEKSNVTLRSTTAFSVALQRIVRVVLVRKLKANNTYMEALLFSTDITSTTTDIYLYYTARFQIEFVIRDAKQHTGLAHCQSRIQERIDFHINMSFAAINIAKFNEHKRLGDSSDMPCSITTQRVRHHNEMLIESFFPMFGLDTLEFKSHPAYEHALSFGAIHV